jgi:PAS domain S-box-containing protein
MSDPGWGLSPDSLDQVWPFHLVLDQDMSIRQAGSAMRRLGPRMLTGQGLEDVLDVVSPRGAVSWESLKSRPRSLFVMKLKQTDVTLRGQMLYDDAGQVITFLGSPWITDLASIPDLGLTLEDFSVSDSIVDHLLLLQTQDVALSQARTLAERLQHRSLELKAHARRHERLTGELESVLNAAADGIYGVDALGVITFANKAAGHLVGRAPAAMIGKKVDEVLRSEISAETPGAQGDTLPGGDQLRAEIGRHFREDGSEFDSERISAPILEDGVQVGSVVVFRDITERRAVDRAKGDFIALVSHELRTPLTSIIGYLDMLDDVEEPIPEEALRYLAAVSRNSDRLLLLVTDLLTANELENTPMRLNLAPTDLSALANQSLDDLSHRASEAGITLIRDLHRDLVITADVSRLTQVVDNLLSNAVKFTPAGGRISVTLLRQGHGVDLIVEDTGIGIETASLPHLTTKFFRTPRATAAAIPGVGLGLMITNAVVEAHHGTLTFTSREHEGTSVRVHLPKDPQPSPMTTQPRSTDGHLKPGVGLEVPPEPRGISYKE